VSAAPAAPARWAASEAAQTLCAWRAPQLAALARCIEGALQAWRAGWGLEDDAAAPRCEAAGAAQAAAGWVPLGGQGEAAAWIALPPDFDAALGRALLAVEQPATPLARAVFERCRGAMQELLLGTLRLDGGASRGSLRSPPAYEWPAGDPPSKSLFSNPWSGTVHVALPWSAGLLLNAALVRLLLPACGETQARAPAAGPALVAVQDALATQRLPLRVELGECELALGSLQDLRPGDVVRVPHALEAPLAVRDAAGRAVLAGYLARRGGSKALQLAATDRPAIHTAKVQP
jgi:hypothetical protein